MGSDASDRMGLAGPAVAHESKTWDRLFKCGKESFQVGGQQCGLL
jgi:hypothetical protein